MASPATSSSLPSSSSPSSSSPSSTTKSRTFTPTPPSPQQPPAQKSPPTNTDHAPIYDVPAKSIVNIEHPCIIRNLENGFKSLGGEGPLLNILDRPNHDSDGSDFDDDEEDDDETSAAASIGVSLRPNDPLAHKLVSIPVETNNVLVKVTLPKRTGRVRKKGTNDPWVDSGHINDVNGCITASDLLQRLRDNPEKYTLEPVGTIRSTHRFRDPPDIQMCASDIPMMQEIKNHAMHPDYDRLKQFQVNLTPGSEGITQFPAPPRFLPLGQPYRYDYLQLRRGGSGPKRKPGPVPASNLIPSQLAKSLKRKRAENEDDDILPGDSDAEEDEDDDEGSDAAQDEDGEDEDADDDRVGADAEDDDEEGEVAEDDDGGNEDAEDDGEDDDADDDDGAGVGVKDDEQNGDAEDYDGEGADAEDDDRDGDGSETQQA